MFGHDNQDDSDDNNDPIQPSTTPVNEAFLGVHDDDDAATPAPAQTPVDEADFEEETVGAEEEHDEAPAPTPPPTAQSTPNESNDLLDIKRQALHDLSPIVDQLDQTPEEKFKTTMMMIQATDDQSLIPHAYRAAQNMSDDKERAQALLDVVNEINFFTQAQK